MSIEEIKEALYTLKECQVYFPGCGELDAGWYRAMIQCIDRSVQGVCTIFLYCPDISGGMDLRIQGRGESIQFLRVKQTFGMGKEKECVCRTL